MNKLDFLERWTADGAGKSIFWRFGVLLLVVSCAAYGGPTGLQPLQSVQQAVADYLKAQNANAVSPPTVTVGALDTRLRLDACAAPLEPFTPPGQGVVGTVTVGVRCPTPTPWTVYVQASVALIQPVVVVRHPLPGKAVLGPDDVEVVERDVARLTLGYISSEKEAIGMVLRRSVTAGTVLNPGLIRSPAAIRRGERVTILGQIGGVEVRMAGVALVDGAKGEVIRVRNLSSGREVEGVVVAPGIVQVRL